MKKQLKVVIAGEQYMAKEWDRFPGMNARPDYFLHGPNGRMDTTMTRGGSHPKYSEYVYFRWPDGRTYYLPKNVIPLNGSTVIEVKETESCERQS